MPTAGKRRGKRKRTKVDPFEVQIAVRYKAPKDTRVSRKLLEQAVRHWADTGDAPGNMQIEVIRWRNPSRSKRSLETWRYPKNKSEKQCALVKRFLRHGGRISIKAIRGDE